MLEVIIFIVLIVFLLLLLLKIGLDLFFFSFTGAFVLCDGVCQWRGFDVSYPEIQKV